MTEPRWIRLHSLPKQCRYLPQILWGAKEHYYFNQSYIRYRLTLDGMYLDNVGHTGEIGKIDSVRFIESPTINRD